MVHNKRVNTSPEREKLVLNLEEHRQLEKKLLEAIKNVRRLNKQALALQREARHLVAQSRKVNTDS